MTELTAIDTLKPAQLAELLSLQSLTVWDGEDAGLLLLRQLDVPLVPDVFAAPQVERLYGLTFTEACWATETFLSALRSSCPPKEVFQAIKEFAQYVQTLPESPLRGGPATVLYYAAIAACFVERGVHISTLKAGQIRDGCIWASCQPGAKTLHSVFERALMAYEKE